MRHLLLALLLGGCADYTVCANESARKLDPQIQDELRTAVAYWELQGYAGLTVVDDTTCDVEVRTTTELSNSTWASSNRINPEVLPTCFPDWIRINANKWKTIAARGLAQRVITHEVGHLYCFDDETTGVMSEKAHL